MNVLEGIRNRMGLSRGSHVLTWVSCVLSFIAAILHAVAFGSPHWVQSSGLSPFVKIGFHTVCFYRCEDPYCPGDTSGSIMYDGCSWVWDEYMRELWTWVMPDWYTSCRYMTLALVAILAVAFLILLLCACLAVLDRNRQRPSRKMDFIYILCLFIVSAIFIISIIMLAVVLGLMYLRGFDLTWMPIPEKNHLGYSYWLEAVTCVMVIATCVMTVSAAVFKLLRWQIDRDEAVAEDLMMGGR